MCIGGARNYPLSAKIWPFLSCYTPTGYIHTFGSFLLHCGRILRSSGHLFYAVLQWALYDARVPPVL